MPSRFGRVKLNLMRAIEIFQDLNHDDMDVSAPPSSREYHKEEELAMKLNNYLNQLIEDGFFDDCEARDVSSNYDDDDDGDEERGSYMTDDELDSQGSQGFEYSTEGRNSGNAFGSNLNTHNSNNNQEERPASRASFTQRFKNYVQRILPGAGGRRNSNKSSERYQENNDDENPSSSSSLSSAPGSTASRSASLGRESSSDRQRRLGSLRNDLSEGSVRSAKSASRSYGSEPYNPNIVYEHRHRHKHNHPGSHHHHEHNEPHIHTYHSHASDEPIDENDQAETSLNAGQRSNQGSEDSSDDQQDELSSNGLPSRPSTVRSRSRSRSLSRSRSRSRSRSASAGRRSLSGRRSRESSRSSKSGR